MFSKKEFAIISNLRFISRENFMFSWVEHEKSFITSGPGLRSVVQSDSTYDTEQADYIVWFCFIDAESPFTLPMSIFDLQE